MIKIHFEEYCTLTSITPFLFSYSSPRFAAKQAQVHLPGFLHLSSTHRGCIKCAFRMRIRTSIQRDSTCHIQWVCTSWAVAGTDRSHSCGRQSGSRRNSPRNSLKWGRCTAPPLQRTHAAYQNMKTVYIKHILSTLNLLLPFTL